MRHPPPLAHLLYYPVTAHVGAAAISLTLAWWAGVDVSFLMTDYHTGHGEPWRLLTSTLLHANLLHLGFNLWCIWAFGTIIEDKLGTLRTIAIYLMLAAGSSAAEFAVSTGGVGISGVAYGLFGLLWVLSHRDPRFIGSVDRQDAILLVSWFFICILLTIANIMPIGNVAHGSGALLGYLLGWAMSARTRRQRALCGAGLAATLVLFAVGVQWARPYINFSRSAAAELYNGGTLELEEGRPDVAVKLLREAVRMRPREPNWWHNLGVAYYRLDRRTEADDALRRERELRPDLVER